MSGKPKFARPVRIGIKCLCVNRPARVELEGQMVNVVLRISDLILQVVRVFHSPRFGR